MQTSIALLCHHVQACLYRLKEERQALFSYLTGTIALLSESAECTAHNPLSRAISPVEELNNARMNAAW